LQQSPALSLATNHNGQSSQINLSLLNKLRSQITAKLKQLSQITKPNKKVPKTNQMTDSPQPQYQSPQSNTKNYAKSSAKTNTGNSTEDNKRLRRSLEQSRAFGDLDADLITNLANTMTMSVIPGGEQLLRQGEASDSLLVVVSGRLLASRRLPDGTSQRLAEIGPGSSVGEVGLILQQPRAADVVAIRDTSVARLTHQQFEQLLIQHPVALNRAISRTIFEYSRQSTSRPPTIGATTFAVVPLDASVDTSALCLGISKALAQYGRVNHLTPAEGETFHTGTGASIQSNDRLNDLEQQFDYLLFEASAQATPWSQLAIRQADQLILVANADTDPWVMTLNDTSIDDLFDGTLDGTLDGKPATIARKSLVLLHPADATTPTVNHRWHQNLELERIYPIRACRERDEQRLVRFMTDNAVGLVLGGGGARGLAHVGVLKALHESNIPIDMVCGNSMGALIGAQYVYGTEIDQLVKTTTRFVRGGERPTLPLFSLLSGKRVRRDLQRMFKDIAVESLWRPFFAVSCNLSRAVIKVHDTGPLWQSVLASNSPAGILPPVILNGDLLVDAALLDNVPVSAMRQRLRFGTLIAVDVDVSEELTVDPQLERLTGWQVLRQRLFHRNETRLPGIVDLLHRSGHLGGLAHRDASKAMADHYLQPPTAKFALMAYGKGEEIAQTGYRYAMEQIAQWDLPIK
jgi:predicted acylesterase/phospholipase RssA